ncbi:TRAP transporter small permease subunit [Oscillibacter sp.]|uniref:TRAP transporter small permease n=1 Tax=Oscillibacter sp. TaxID=1945593 RepID=UPI0028981A09|nr:TRAP transporter small permease subunit [Oscillibacter sp.]
MGKIERILNGLAFVTKALAALCLGIMLVVSLAEIVRRYMFGLSFSWADELIRDGVVCVAMLGGAAAYREEGGLVAFDLISAHVKGTTKLILTLVINTICLLFSGYMFMNALQTLQTPSIVKQVSIGLKISMFWPYLPNTLGLGIIFIFTLEKFYNIFIGRQRGAYQNKAEEDKAQ